MKLKTVGFSTWLAFSVACIVLALANVTWAARFPAPPGKGGIPQLYSKCAANLGSCNRNLAICEDRLVDSANDLQACNNELETCDVDLVTCQENSIVFPATGQVTCYTQSGNPIACHTERAEDGYFRAGGSLAYIWNNDGTLVDVNTKLMWERKDMSGGLHDIRKRYRWTQSFRDHVSLLKNTCKSDETVSCSSNGDADCVVALGAGEVCGFAGYRDWRLPNVKELQSIADYSGISYAAPLSFHWFCSEGCSLMGPDSEGCSCPMGASWTSTSSAANFPELAWYVSSGHVDVDEKYNEKFVRAVRGGYVDLGH